MASSFSAILRYALLVFFLTIDEAASFVMAWYNLRPLKASVGVTASTLHLLRSIASFRSLSDRQWS
jgi:hypothetical protein